jgi:hypothetical protein
VSRQTSQSGLIGFCTQGVAQPWAKRLPRNFAAVAVEQRQLAAGLRQATLEIAALRLGRPHASRAAAWQVGRRREDGGATFFLRCSTHGQAAVNDD